MDKLQHIDQLLKEAAQVPANAFVFDRDWEVIEKKLRRRKNRIFALWFFLALICSSIPASIIYTSITSNKTPTVQHVPQLKNNTDMPITEGDISQKLQALTSQVEESASILKTNDKPVRIQKAIQEKISPINAKTQSNTHIPVVYEQIYTPVLKPLNSKHLFSFHTIETKAWDLKIPTAIKSQGPVTTNTANNITNTHKKDNKKHWEIGPSFTPSFVGRFLNANSSNENVINPLYTKLVAESEKISFASSYGINVQYHPNSSFFLGSGLLLSQRGEAVNYDYSITNFAIVDLNTNLVTGYGELKPQAQEKVTYKGSNSYHFIEIPLNIGYKHTISTNFEIRSQVGVSYMNLIQREGRKGNPISLQLDDLKSLNLNAHNIGASLKSGVYLTRSNVVVGVEPVFGININSLDHNTSLIKTKPYSYGLNINTHFNLYKK